MQQQVAAAASTATRISLGVQPRGNKLKPLVAEFGHYLCTCSPARDKFLVEKFLANTPKGSRVTSRRIFKWSKLQSSVRAPDKCEFLGGVPSPSKGPCELWQSEPIEICHIGVPSDPLDFIARAVTAGHPRGYDAFVDSGLRQAAKDNFEGCPYTLAKRRIAALKFWTSPAYELKESEKSFHDSLDPHLQDLLKGKRLLLFKEMSAASGCQDTCLVADIASGFPLSGWLRSSGSFLPQVKRPDFDVKTLLLLAKGVNRSTLAKLRNRQDSELEAATWRGTETELEKGWVWLDPNPSLSSCSLAMRFGIRQGEKIRVIDDCSLCKLNSTVGLKEKFQLHTIDKLAAVLAQAFIRSILQRSFANCVGAHST